MHKSEVKYHNGVPMLFVDGEPIPPMGFDYMPSDPDITNNIPIPPAMPSEIQLRAMHSAGVRLFFIRVELRDPQNIDDILSKLLRSVRKLRECAPGAYAIPWLIISPYEDFANKYPQDVQTFDDGTVGNYSSILSGRMPNKEIPRHTHSSLAWRHETAGVLRYLVRKIRSTPELDDAVVGSFFFPLHHESNYFYDYDHDQKLDDYGPATRLAMRNYLAEKYAGDVNKLRAAWNDPSIDFETAPLPTRQERTVGTAGNFWDPAKSRKVMDYAEIRSKVWADTLAYFSRACKEESGFQAVVGAFWGYLLHNNTLWGGQGWFRNMMDCPYLDFWASPFHYNNKSYGHSVTLRQLERSVQKHGKLFFSEVDTGISTSSKHESDRQGMLYDDDSHDADIVKRDFSMTLTNGLNGWWTDFSAGKGMYYEEGLLPVVRQIEKIGRESVGKPMGSVSEIAAIVDQDSLFCVPQESQYSPTAIEQPRLYELPYLGAPIDNYELNDVLDGQLPHKVYIFQNAYLLDQNRRDAICQLKNQDRTLVFMYAQGFLSNDGPTAHADNISALTGIRIKQAPGTTSGRIVLTEQAKLLGLVPGAEIGESDKLITSGMSFYGNNFVPFYPNRIQYDPVFFVDDPDAIVLGVYKDSNLPAFAMKTVNGANCVYIGSAILNTAVLRGLCKLQGVHLYTDEDAVIYANQSYVGIHAVKDGPVTLQLPDAGTLREVFDDQIYSTDAGKLTLDLHLGQTKLFERIV